METVQHTVLQGVIWFAARDVYGGRSHIVKKAITHTSTSLLHCLTK